MAFCFCDVLCAFLHNETFLGLLLTHYTLVDSSTVIHWTRPFIFLGVLGLFCHFCCIFDGKSC